MAPYMPRTMEEAKAMPQYHLLKVPMMCWPKGARAHYEQQAQQAGQQLQLNLNTPIIDMFRRFGPLPESIVSTIPGPLTSIAMRTPVPGGPATAPYPSNSASNAISAPAQAPNPTQGNAAQTTVSAPAPAPAPTQIDAASSAVSAPAATSSGRVTTRTNTSATRNRREKFQAQALAQADSASQTQTSQEAQGGEANRNVGTMDVDKEAETATEGQLKTTEDAAGSLRNAGEREDDDDEEADADGDEDDGTVESGAKDDEDGDESEGDSGDEEEDDEVSGSEYEASEGGEDEEDAEMIDADDDNATVAATTTCPEPDPLDANADADGLYTTEYIFAHPEMSFRLVTNAAGEDRWKAVRGDERAAARTALATALARG